MRNILTLVVLIFVSNICFSQDAEVKKNKKSSVITFEKVLHDFGDIEYEGNGTCEFYYKNTGKEPLVLENVRASCGCTIPEWSKEPLKKGKKAVIKVKYDTKRVGQFQKTITVVSNASNSTEQLTIKGNVLQNTNGEKKVIEEKVLPVKGGEMKRGSQKKSSKIIEEENRDE